MRRGDIYYIEKAAQTGHEQIAGRPAIIVSSNKCRWETEVLEVVYLTTSPKVDLPTHVTIRSALKLSTALCEQVTSVSVSRIGSFLGTCTEEEMAAIDTALSISLGLSVPASVTEAADEATALQIKELGVRLSESLKMQEFWENMYHSLLDKVIK